MALITDPISAIAGAVQTIVERVIPDPTAQLQAKTQMAQMLLNGEIQQVATSAGVVTAETNSTSWLTKSWRPITMLVFVTIIANNYLLYPYLSLFWHAAPQLPIPDDMWGLLKLGIGGYVLGRSVEKITTPDSSNPHPDTGAPQSPLSSTLNSVISTFRGA